MERPPPPVQTVLDPIEVDPGDFLTGPMARGEPGVPRHFTWRGERFEVTEVLESRRETGPCRNGSDEVYVRRHVTRCRTAGGAVVTLSGSRGGRRPGPRWILRTIERA